MKYIKKFESTDEENKYWNEGDYVKCIDIEFTDGLTLGKTYKIINFKIINSHLHFRILNDDKKLDTYSKLRFVEANKEDIEKYKIEQEEEKYNL